MFYHDQADQIVADFKAKKLTKSEAFSKLETLENQAYALIPNAEPDGDITYCVACAVNEILQLTSASTRQSG
jgi:hypothetical protein